MGPIRRYWEGFFETLDYIVHDIEALLRIESQKIGVALLEHRKQHALPFFGFLRTVSEVTEPAPRTPKANVQRISHVHLFK